MYAEETDLNLTELLTRATSLLDLSDALAEAIEQNYQHTAQLRAALLSGGEDPPFDPRPAMSAHGKAQALVAHAESLLRAQERELETLVTCAATRRRADDRQA